MEDQRSSGLKVIIIGAAITGLTLAHALDKAGIDYVVLEKHQDVRANIGGTIGMQPNGCRILDQVGVFDSLKKWRNDIDVIEMIPPDSRGFSVWLPNWYPKWLGYPFTMVRRKGLLDCLYTSLKDLSKVKLGIKVVGINSSLASGSLVSVETDDGQRYTGDVVIGADGVHGITRTEMWRAADSQSPGIITDKDRKSMTVDYICIFGITEPAKSITDVLKPRTMFVPSYHKLNWMVMPHADNSISWFVNLRLDKTHVHPDFRPWSQEQVSAKMKDLLDHDIWGPVKFRHLWERTPSVSSAPLYEGMIETSTFNRIACLGDSVFKMTTTNGMGANVCLECVTILADTLQHLNSFETKPSHVEIQAALTDSAESIRKILQRPLRISHFVTRLCALETAKKRLFLQYVAPIVWRPMFIITVLYLSIAQTLNYLPLPDRAIRAQDQLMMVRKKVIMIASASLGALIGLGIYYYWFIL